MAFAGTLPLAVTPTHMIRALMIKMIFFIII